MTSRGARRAALASSLVLAGCSGAALPEPVREPPCIAAPCRGAHEGETPIEVPFPPPPAKVDVIGDPPAELVDPVWIDGQWEWRGRAWIWEPGTWRSRPPSQYYAAPAIVRRPDGQLVWFAGSFRPFGPALPVPPAAAGSAGRSDGPRPRGQAPAGGGSKSTLFKPPPPGEKTLQSP